MCITPEKKSEQDNVESAAMKQVKYRILVVEDEEDLRQLFSDILTYNGYEVETASEGHQGLEMFRQGGFDLVFTDLRMPGMSGWKVAKGIKKRKENIPVVMITGSTLQLETSELKKSGVDFVINKPFKIDNILRLVREVLLT